MTDDVWSVSASSNQCLCLSSEMYIDHLTNIYNNIHRIPGFSDVRVRTIELTTEMVTELIMEFTGDRVEMINETTAETITGTIREMIAELIGDQIGDQIGN